MSRSAGAIPVTRFHDDQGRPTCCLKWGSKHDTCPLLRTGDFGLQEVCNWTDGPIERNGPQGLLIPVSRCPVHPEHERSDHGSISEWEPIRSAPLGEWLQCRNANGTRFEARKDDHRGMWLDRGGLYREPKEWRYAPY